MNLETDRLLLRKPELRDFPEYWAMKNDKEATRFTGGITQYNYDERLELFKKEWVDADQNTEFSIVIKADDEYIGYCSLIDNNGIKNEIIFGIKREAWRKGYCYEAAVAILQYGFSVLKHSRIVATVNPQNLASERILQKAGMILDYSGEAAGVLLRRYKLDATDFFLQRNSL